MADRERSSPVISLTTDFGMVDPYVAEMKAVILSICPEAKVIDISHLVEKFNIRMGAFFLASAAPYFPPRSVHVAVVDPGVGGERRPIVIETDRSLFVGPDNGVLVPAAQAEQILHVYKIANSSLMRAEVSSTFHGRDVFAPVAAYLARGTRPRECGHEISDYVIPSYSQPKTDENAAHGEVLHVDSFGNVVTNLRIQHLGKWSLNSDRTLQITVGKKRISARYVGTYSEIKKGEFGFLVGSHGFLEISCRERSAATRFLARSGMAVRISNA